MPLQAAHHVSELSELDFASPLTQGLGGLYGFCLARKNFLAVLLHESTAVSKQIIQNISRDQTGGSYFSHCCER